ncbi:hypothetical protein FRC09_007765 [Ceratobasidium sp. 395]|nr:hypothetical protein FRC09_007765 [Ceratobasidium sp. 395]
MTCKCNKAALAKLASGEIWGTVCTDVAGMGIDISDIDYVVQYELSEDYPTMEKDAPTLCQKGPIKLDEDDFSNWTDVDRGLEEALYLWRDNLAKAKWGPYHLVGGLGIMDDKQIVQIVKLPQRWLIPTAEDFERELKWVYMPEHGASVLSIVHSSHPPLPGPPPAPSASASNPNAPLIRQTKPWAPPQCSACSKSGYNSM